MLLPVRTAVLNYLYQVGSADVDGIMKALKPQYGKEGQFTKKLFLEHVMSLEANGLINLEGYDLDQRGELILRYKINDDGKGTVEKYVSKEFRKK